MKIHLKITGLLFLLGIVVGIGFYGIHKDYYTSTQMDIFLVINHALSGTVFGPNFWLNITALGDALILFPLLSFFVFKNTQAWAALFGAVPLSAILSHFGKAFFSVSRPAAIIDADKFTIMGKTLTGATSLPSGHTITIFAMVSAVLLVLFYNNKKNYNNSNNSSRKAFAVWAVGLISLAFVVAISRVAIGAHWPADLLLGAIFGFFGGLSGAILTFKYSTWWRWITKPQFWYVKALIIIAVSFAMIVEYSQLVVAWLSLIVAVFVTIKLLALKKNVLNESL
ncbi:MAG: phosphatase PAP2 family protein [Bdellovibrionaceae bacterium]|nr:phosphatase PAP2 family protein [Pseudobdellovibrionaceae bacterium]